MISSRAASANRGQSAQEQLRQCEGVDYLAAASAPQRFRCAPLQAYFRFTGPIRNHFGHRSEAAVLLEGPKIETAEVLNTNVLRSFVKTVEFVHTVDANGSVVGDLSLIHISEPTRRS